MMGCGGGGTDAISPPPSQGPWVITPVDTTSDTTTNTGIAAPYGDVIGTYNGIAAKSNGDQATDRLGEFGLEFECVEYVNRYYIQKLHYTDDHCGFPGNMRSCGNGVDYYPHAATIGLTPYANGGTVPPQPEDIISFSGGSTKAFCPQGCGHVAIVRGVFPDHIRVIQQNWNNDRTDGNYSIAMTIVNGHYTVLDHNGYHAQGWLRLPGR